MQAIIYPQYGPPDVLELKEIKRPTSQSNELLINVRAAALNAADWRLMRAKPAMVRLETGLLRPKNQILGSDIAGTVVAIGANVTRFQVGDEVFGDLSEDGLGGFAEYVCADEDMVEKIPAGVPHHQAAAVPMAAVTALQALRTVGKLQAGQHVLINGASGGVGSFAVQLAKYFDAEVTAVCSTRKSSFVRSLGADHLIDYKKENFTQNGKLYDLIIAANGYHPLADYRRSLKPSGTYVCSGGELRQLFAAMLLGSFMHKRYGKKMSSLQAKPKGEDLQFIGRLLQSGDLIPTIDACYPLRELPQAMARLEEGQAEGKLVIDMAA